MHLLGQKHAARSEHPPDLRGIEGALPVEDQVEFSRVKRHHVDVGQSHIDDAYTQRLEPLADKGQVGCILLRGRHSWRPVIFQFEKAFATAGAQVQDG